MRSTLSSMIKHFLFISAICTATFTQTSQANTIKVLAQPPEIISDGQTYEAVGTGIAEQSINLYPVVEEKVTQIHFKAQQKVKRNALLVQLENREEILALELARTQMKNASSLLQRYLQAVEQGAVPQTQVDQAKADFEAAKVAVERAKLDLEDRQIRAPFSGIVGIPQINLGQRIKPDDLVTGLDNREIIYIDINLPEALLPKLSQSGNKPITMRATTPSLPEHQFVATVESLESRLNPNTRTLRLRTKVDNKKDLIKPGMSFTLVWDIEGTERPAVSEIALQWSREGSYVWIVREGKANRIPVQVVGRQHGKVLLKGNITPEDLIIIEGIQRVREGSPVELISTTKS